MNTYIATIDLAKLDKENLETVREFASFLTTFLTKWSNSLESNQKLYKGIHSGFTLALDMIRRFTFVDDAKLLKTCLDYWIYLSARVFRECRCMDSDAAKDKSHDIYMIHLVDLKQKLPSRLEDVDTILILDKNENGDEVYVKVMKDCEELKPLVEEVLQCLAHADCDSRSMIWAADNDINKLPPIGVESKLEKIFGTKLSLEFCEFVLTEGIENIVDIPQSMATAVAANSARLPPASLPEKTLVNETTTPEINAASLSAIQEIAKCFSFVPNIDGSHHVEPSSSQQYLPAVSIPGDLSRSENSELVCLQNILMRIEPIAANQWIVERCESQLDVECGEIPEAVSVYEKPKETKWYCLESPRIPQRMLLHTGMLQLMDRVENFSPGYGFLNPMDIRMVPPTGFSFNSLLTTKSENRGACPQQERYHRVPTPQSRQTYSSLQPSSLPSFQWPTNTPVDQQNPFSFLNGPVQTAANQQEPMNLVDKLSSQQVTEILNSLMKENSAQQELFRAMENNAKKTSVLSNGNVTLTELGIVQRATDGVAQFSPNLPISTPTNNNSNDIDRNRGLQNVGLMNDKGFVEFGTSPRAAAKRRIEETERARGKVPRTNDDYQKSAQTLIPGNPPPMQMFNFADLCQLLTQSNQNASDNNSHKETLSSKNDLSSNGSDKPDNAGC
ncbi:unnamed protein product [Caenorhabditis bovis]|uniref:Uncharacterized protein n=1 Tax=Caenorhabditis bovis TaxID=2654633 RepID=A0A8S1EVA3_9PELO|nr:unnamed protein product [Caenorhabditis bovis]